MYRFFLAASPFFNGATVGVNLGHLIEPGPHWAPHWSRVVLGIIVAAFLVLIITFDERPPR